MKEESATRRQRGVQRKTFSHHQQMLTGVVINLQVFLQPLVLLEEKIHAKFEIEINFSGEGDDVR